MLKLTIFIACLLAAASAQVCGTDELLCGVYCYEPSQYTCTEDPLRPGTLQLCGAGTSPCNGACIADCGYFCNVTSGLAEPNDDDELECPPDCSARDGYGACGSECIDTSAFCCISEESVPLAQCPFNKKATKKTSNCPFAFDSTGELWDGQLRLSFGPGASPATFNLTNGQLVDNRGQICYISLGGQLQCNFLAQTSDFTNFGVTDDGYLTHNDSTLFWQCPVGTGGYNIMKDNEGVCTPVAIKALFDCPAPPQPPICTKSVDIAVVIDMSGSVSNSQFKAITDFTLNFASQFSFGASRMGLVWFGNTGAYKTNGLLADREAFYRAANTSRPTQAQSSCLGCGLDLGLKMLQQNTRTGVPQVMLVLTDGQSNVPQNTPRGCWAWNGRTCIGGSAGVLPAPNWVDEVAELKAQQQLTVFGLGVVADGNLQENIMKKFSDKYMCIGKYEQLVASVNKIRDSTCEQGSTPTTSAPASTRVATSTKAPTSSTKAPTSSTKISTTAVKVCPTRCALPLPWAYFSFDFDFKSGSKQCKDNSGNNRHGSLKGDLLSLAKGVIGNGAGCNKNKKQYISVPSVQNLNSEFSIATWVNLTGVFSDRVTIASTSAWSLILIPKGNGQGRVYFVKGWKILTWNINIDANVVFHLGFTVDDDGTATCYKDGVSLGSTQSCGRMSRCSGELRLCSHDKTFSGVFDDLFIFSKCLKKTEIEAVRDNYCR